MLIAEDEAQMKMTKAQEEPSRNRIRYASATDQAEREYYDELYQIRQATRRKLAYDYNAVGRAPGKISN